MKKATFGGFFIVYDLTLLDLHQLQLDDQR